MNCIEFEQVSKRFVLHREKRNSFQERVVNLLQPRGESEMFWALRDVSFNVPAGETLGLIDFELKRLGYVTAMPLGVELSGPPPAARTALQRARATLERHSAAATSAGSAPFDDPDPDQAQTGMLLSRDHRTLAELLSGQELLPISPSRLR